MKIERRDDAREREVLTGMILHDTVLGRIASRWDGHLFASPSANAVATLCVEHYRKYNQAPRKAMRSLFSTWGEGRDEDSVKLAESLLEGLSNDYTAKRKEVNPDLVLDIAGRYFNKVKMTKLKDDLESHLAAGKLKAAEETIQSFYDSKIHLGTESGVDPLLDDAFMKSVFDDNVTALVKYPGALGDFFSDSLVRDGFFTFIAAEKVGKSQMLLDVAYRATRQRVKTAFFGVGDMSAAQVARRLYSRMAKVPYRSPNGKWPCKVMWPTKIEKRQHEELADVELEELEFGRKLSYADAKEAVERFLTRGVKSKKSMMRWYCCPAGTLSVGDIDGILDSWELEGWGSADVVVIDYADILAPEKGSKMETRDQINKTWEKMRALSLKRHNLVVTATQANREAYDARTINRRHASEDKRKWSHCSAAVGLNVTAEEKDKQLMRLNYVMRREGEYNWRKEVHVAQCLALANPCVLSCF